MSESTISSSFITQFSPTVHTLVRERSAKLGQIFMTEDAPGEKHMFDRVGSLNVYEITGEAADTNIQNAAHSRRMATLRKYAGHVGLDDINKIKMLLDPTNAYTLALADAHGKNYDIECYTQMLGTAATGKDGSGTQAFDTSNYQIAHGSTGLTVAKLHQGLRILEAGELDIDSVQLYLAAGAFAVEDLLTDTTNGVQLTSFDYQDSKALVDGKLPNFRGMNFIRTQRVPDHTAGSVRRALLFTRDCMKVAVRNGLEIKTAERADKEYLLQISAYMRFGAVRMEEKLAVDILYQ